MDSVHVVEGYMLGYGDDERNLGSNGFFNGGGGVRSGHEDGGGIWANGVNGLEGSMVRIEKEPGLHTA